MCGRFALHATTDEIRSYFKLKSGFAMRPRYNIAPSDVIPVITKERILQFYRWGFIPSWTKCAMGEWPQQFINARSETILEKPSFRQAIKLRRCVVPANGYFEWKKIREKKQPYYVFSKAMPLFGFAGIWETWQRPEGDKIETVAILTKNADEVLSSLHERMPIALNVDEQDVWLNEKTKPESLVDLLKNTSTHFSFYLVPATVNNPRFDQPACIEVL